MIKENIELHITAGDEYKTHPKGIPGGIIRYYLNNTMYFYFFQKHYF